MLTPGHVAELDLGVLAGSEAGLRRPAVVVTASRILRGRPNVVQVVPLTRTIRTSSTEVLIDPDEINQLVSRSSAQCQHVRSAATTHIQERTGHVGSVVLNEVRETLALLLDLSKQDGEKGRGAHSHLGTHPAYGNRAGSRRSSN